VDLRARRAPGGARVRCTATKRDGKRCPFQASAAGPDAGKCGNHRASTRAKIERAKATRSANLRAVASARAELRRCADICVRELLVRGFASGPAVAQLRAASALVHKAGS
jgi:hypothetical protein